MSKKERKLILSKETISDLSMARIKAGDLVTGKCAAVQNEAIADPRLTAA